MNHLKFQDPMILKFERVDYDSGLIHLPATPQPQCAAQKQDAAAQSPETERPGESSALTTADAAAPLKPGDLIIVKDICMDKEYRALVVAYVNHPEFGGPGYDVRIIGEPFQSHWKDYRLPTPAELAEANPWISWAGGECPVAAGTRVEIKTRSEETLKVMRPELWQQWRHDRPNRRIEADIIAYRVLP
jgi:hypothetical protein